MPCYGFKTPSLKTIYKGMPIKLLYKAKQLKFLVIAFYTVFYFLSEEE